MNKFIEKLQFKKIVIFYIAIALIVGITLLVCIGEKFQNKLKFIYDYHYIKESLEKNNYNFEDIKGKIQEMSDNTEDVKDILIMDKENKITYSTKSSEFANQETFTLNKADDMPNHYFINADDNNNIFRLTSDKELIISTVLSNFDTEIQKECEDEVFYEENYQDKNVYLLSYITNENTGEKIYFINEIHPVENGKTYIKVALAVMMFFFMIYWVLLALYIYQNALKSKLNPYLWGGITLITNIAGVIIYIIYKQNQKTCFKCGASQDKSHIYCTYCGAKLNETCKKCGSVVNNNDKYCAKCGEKHKKEE